VDLCALPDGRVVTIRPIRADDRERLRRSHARLSEETRYRRFLSSKPSLTPSDVHYLVDIDGWDHYALVATVAEPEGEAIVAVARYVRLPRDPDAAEFAIVVGDAWQGQGLGTELLGRLADAAVTRGIERFYAAILADNVAIRHLIERFADGPVNRRRDGTTFEVDFPLPTRGHVEPPGRGAPAMIAVCAGS
jgi:RimJ/RimL family protein N-acetyltransferase